MYILYIICVPRIRRNILSRRLVVVLYTFMNFFFFYFKIDKNHRVFPFTILIIYSRSSDFVLLLFNVILKFTVCRYKRVSTHITFLCASVSRYKIIHPKTIRYTIALKSQTYRNIFWKYNSVSAITFNYCFL